MNEKNDREEIGEETTKKMVQKNNQISSLSNK